MTDTKPTSEKRSRRGTLRNLICFLIASGVGFQWWYHHAGPGYYAELNAVREHLNRMSDIEVSEMKWRDDDDFPLLPQLCCISARIKIRGGGELLLHNLTDASFQEAPHLLIGAVGSVTFRYRGEGFRGSYRAATGEPTRSQFAGGGISVGPEGDFAGLFPFRIPNVQTAITRYPEIAKVVESWSTFSQPPGTFTTANGTEYCYWVAPNGVNEADRRWSSDPNWHQPYAQLRARAGIARINLKPL